MSPLKPALAFVGAAGAAWLSLATLAMTDAAFSHDRIAFLPLSTVSLTIVIAAATGVATAAWRSRRAGFLVLCSLIVLPWLPSGVPPAFLLWSGPMAVLPWVALGFAVLAGVRTLPRWPVTRDPAVAGAIAFAVFSVSAWSASPSVPGGDEPHYLIITQSLLYDGDLRIENNHAQGEYREYFAGELRPDYLKRGVDGEIYSIHAPGLPALVAPAYLAGGYRAVVICLIVASALASALAWHIGWMVTARRSAAWFGWATVTLAATTVFHSFSIYPDGPGGVLVLTGVWALVRANIERESGSSRLTAWAFHGAALALLPWLHSRFAVLAGALGALIVLRLIQAPDRIGKIAAFATVPAVSCAGWFAFFLVIYGTPSPSAPYGGEIGSAAYIADGLAGLFFDQRFGLLPYAPVLACAFVGMTAMLVRPARAGHPRLALELLAVLVPYLLLVTYFRMWWGGWSAPARFAVPVLFLMAVPAAVCWTHIERRGTRATALAALAFTLFTTCLLVFVEGGSLAFNVRTDHARWLDWLSRTASLVTALPAWSDRELEFFRDIAIWVAAIAGAWLIVRGLDRHSALRSPHAFAAFMAIVFAAAAMTASTIVWRVNHDDGLRALPAQMDLLRRLADERGLLIGLTPPRALNATAMLNNIRLRPDPIPPPEGAQTGDRLLFAVPSVPAGTYHVRPRATREDGRLAIAVGRAGHPIQTTGTARLATITLPVHVRALTVTGDEAAQRFVRGLTLEPTAIASSTGQITNEYARDAVRYKDDTVFFLDENSFPEGDAFWLGGGRSSDIVVRPDAARGELTLLIRNAPVANRLAVRSGEWHTELHLAPGEERRVTVPMIADAAGTLVTLSASDGFVPADVDRTSRDRRFLGVWVRVD